jgi:uncharacterized membrane protein YdbT with pleckstrin-like domain
MFFMEPFSEDEKILYESRPDSKNLWVWLFTKVIGVGILLLFISFIFFMNFYLTEKMTNPESLINLTNPIIIFIILLILIFLYQIPLLKTYYFYITNKKIILKGGIFIKRKKTIPFHKITDIEISQNIIEQIFNLYKINVHTASQGGPIAEISFFGLKEPKIPEKIINQILNNKK